MARSVKDTVSLPPFFIDFVDDIHVRYKFFKMFDKLSSRAIREIATNKKSLVYGLLLSSRLRNEISWIYYFDDFFF